MTKAMACIPSLASVKTLLNSLKFSSVDVNSSKKPGMSMILIFLPHMIEVLTEHTCVTLLNPSAVGKVSLFKKMFPAVLLPVPVIPLKTGVINVFYSI